MLKWSAFPLKHATGNTMSEFIAENRGAAIGGYALDNIGLTSPLMLSGTLMLLTALLVTAKVKMKKS